VHDVVQSCTSGCAGAAVSAIAPRACAGAPFLSTGHQLVDEPERRAQRPRHVAQQADAHVHLEEGEPHLHALLERLAHGRAGVPAAHIGVAVDADLVAELAAEHLVDGHPIGLAGQVPEGELYGADAAALPGVVAELLDAPKDLVDLAGVLAEDAALEHQRVLFAGAVAHLAIAHQPLVGIDLDQRAPVQHGDAHVGDA
jgi:hypothetical protein